jgi:hypothetical protein
MRIVLTVGDHEQNGFVALAKWSHLEEAEARAAIDAVDASIPEEAEPDIETAAFTFILDLMNENGDLIDNSKRQLPTQTAMALAPDQVRQWLEERPDPDSVLCRHIPEAVRRALNGGTDG